MTTSNIIHLFHHIHHYDGEHKVHHCGGEHKTVDPTVNYTIHHCPCGLHSIDQEMAVGHGVDANLENIEIKVVFKEKCPHGGWHLESGEKI